MHGIISALNKSKLFSSMVVLDLIDEDSVKLIKIKAKTLDSSILYITELHTHDYQKYSYHWQKENGELIIRWDNKPHWKNLKTFPHHRHEKGKVYSSHRINIDDVIKVIQESFKKRGK